MAVFITLSRSEADDAIRKQYGLPSNVEVRIEDDTQSVSDMKSSWINVPSDWVHTEPPEVVSRSEYVDVVDVLFRSGYVSHRRAPKHIDWSQEGLS